VIVHPFPSAADICLRPFEDRDAGAFVAAVRESVRTVGAWMPWCHAQYSAAEADAWFAACRAGLAAATAYDIGIFAGDGTELLGGAGINQINRTHAIGNIGYWVRESRQRRGVATRAVRLMSGYGFDVLGLCRLEIVAAVDNAASRAVAQKAGATFECIARNRLLVAGRPIAAAVYSLLASDLGHPARMPGST
jgi:RimJ/RimL family protein N-acetyltransferase